MTISVPLLLTYLLSILVMIGLPIFLAIFFVKRYRVSWLVVLAGVATFAVAAVLNSFVRSKVFDLFNAGTLPMPSQQWTPVVVALIVGLGTGFFEESMRWIGFTVLGRKRKKFGSALALGAGHGGIESILIASFPYWPIYGGLILTMITVLFYNAGGQIAKGVSSDQVSYMLSQIQGFWSSPWHLGLLPGVERIIAMSTQILLSIMVWKSVADRSFVWFLVAILYHTIVDALAVFLGQIGWSYWAVQGILALFLLLNVYLIYRFIKEEKEIEAEIAELGDVEDEDEDEDDEDDEEDDDEDDEDLDDEEDEVEDEADVEPGDEPEEKK